MLNGILRLATFCVHYHDTHLDKFFVMFALISCIFFPGYIECKVFVYFENLTCSSLITYVSHIVVNTKLFPKQKKCNNFSSFWVFNGLIIVFYGSVYITFLLMFKVAWYVSSLKKLKYKMSASDCRGNDILF